MRLDATPHKAPKAQPQSSALCRTCLECGTSYTARIARGDFCSPRCRKDWNNRRALRGAELYDLFMAHRFDRARAAELRLLGAMNRMASNWRGDDRDRRAGRRSWRDPEAVLADRPYLRAIAVNSGRKKR